MNAYVLHDEPGRGRASQWMASAIAIVAAHLLLIAAALAWYQQVPMPGVEMPAIMVDLSPAPAAPALQPQDLAPGPQMQQAQPEAERAALEKPTNEPVRQQAELQPQPPIEPQAEPQAVPVPVAPAPEVALPPAKAAEQPAAVKPDAPKQAELVKPAAKLKPEPKRATHEEAKRKRAEAKPDSRDPPAPRTTAAPRAERQAALQSFPQAGRAAAAAALPAYRDRLAAHLARFKQYPSASKAAGEQGTAMLSFTVGRSGQVLASRLARSSGYSALDAETMAMIHRAQPLPSFPAEMTQASLSFTVPVNFSLR